jgi:Ca-activated chloride channel family protein
VRVTNATVVLLVDVSGSMAARDVEPSRLDAAIAAMRDFIRGLPRGFKVGVVDFSNSPQVIAEPTLDHVSVGRALAVLTPNEGTAIGDGIASATRMAQRSLAADGVKRKGHARLPAAIVLLSDGQQTQGRLEPLDGAAQARTAGIPVDTVALGKANTVFGPPGPYAMRIPPDPGLMRAIAITTGGRTATARNAEELARFYRSVRSSFGTTTVVRDIASWFAAAAAVLVLAAVCLGRLLAPAV